MYLFYLFDPQLQGDDRAPGKRPPPVSSRKSSEEPTAELQNELVFLNDGVQVEEQALIRGTESANGLREPVTEEVVVERTVHDEAKPAVEALVESSEPDVVKVMIA